MALITCFGLDDSGDFLIANGKFVIVEDVEAIRTMLRTRLNAFKGDWFINRNDGVDYRGEVLGKKQVDTPLQAEFKIAIRGTIGVTEIKSFTADLTSGRTLNIVFTAGTVFSQDIEFNETVGA